MQPRDQQVRMAFLLRVEHGKLTIEVEIRIFPNFPVIIVEK